MSMYPDMCPTFVFFRQFICHCFHSKQDIEDIGLCGSLTMPEVCIKLVGAYEEQSIIYIHVHVHVEIIHIHNGVMQ